MRVELSTSKLASYTLSPAEVAAKLQSANAKVEAGEFSNQNQQIRVDAGSLLTSRDDVEQVVVGVSHGRPILLRDVADYVIDGPAEPSNYVNFGVGQGALLTDPHAQVGAEFPAVTITVAKRKGTNATNIANHVLARIAELKGNTLPSDLNITTTRNYGETAKAKSDDLLKHCCSPLSRSHF